ncbi:DUF6119 family protein [Pedomonas sp. V897]|uniref:DUF6119 family protein n=1 Tax=Pedomonas sp. V897 TaxID=3446482 RepID=UPI003EE05785
MADLKKVTLYKIKSVNRFNEFLLEDGYIDINIGSDITGKIKFETASTKEKTDSNIPWIQFLNSGFKTKKYTYQAKNTFPRAIMAICIPTDKSNLYFAATFGLSGDRYLNKEKIVYDFGIKVGMNICDDAGLRRIQTSAHDTISKQTEHQSSSGAALNVFGVDPEKELLKAISGHVKKEYRDYIDSFKGKESISLKFTKNSNVNWNYFVEICKELEERYQSNDYKSTQFKSYDNFRIELDPTITSELNNILCEKLNSKNFEKIHLAPPEFIESEILFSYKKKSAVLDKDIDSFDDLFIEDALSDRKVKIITIKHLKNWKVYQYDQELDETKPLWSIYNCIVAEISYKNKIFILSNGNWRELSKELKSEVDNFISSNIEHFNDTILPSNVDIWCDEDGINSEEKYNIIASRNCPNLIRLDKARINIAGNKIYEVCDLLHSNKYLIHVKRYKNGTASISHLFTQGKFYAQAFSTDDGCKDDIRKWIGKKSKTTKGNENKNTELFKSIIPEKSRDVKEEEYTVIFCILHESETFTLNDLPFMARYELMLSQRFLSNNRKFKVRVALRRVKTRQAESKKPENKAEGVIAA